MSVANEIREHAFTKYIAPAFRSGKQQAEVAAGDVHRDLGLRNRMPLVCGALGALIFQQKYRLQLLKRSGPGQGSQATFLFAKGRFLKSESDGHDRAC